MKVIVRASSRPRPRFRCPAGGDPRTAILHSALRASGPNRVFDPGAPDLPERIAAFHPHSLAASLGQLLVLHAVLDPAARPDRSIIVLSTPHSMLSPSERDLLWDLYEVPVFEQLLDRAGNLIATECDAHDGLHLVAEWNADWPGRLLDAHCECGFAAPRVAAPAPSAALTAA